MCGIVGCIGHGKIQTVVLNGLEKLEYRGYDSAGLFIMDEDGSTQLVKRVGRIQNLRDAVDEEIPAFAGIGHTRWASDRKQRSPSPITIRSFHISAQRRY